MEHTHIKHSKGKVIAVRLMAILLMFMVGMLLGFAANAQETKQKSNLYAITGNGLKDTSWLFGTYHLVKSSYLNEVPQVMNAFNKAKGVTVELVLDSSKAVVAGSMGLLKDKTLSALLDKPFSDSLDQELKTTLGIGVAQMDRLKPVNVALTLSMVYMVTDTASPLKRYTGSMLDGYFAEKGRSAGKTITELETIEEQMHVLFNSVSDQEQAEQLRYFLRNKSEMIDQGNELLAKWFEHDLDGMFAVSEKGLKVFGNETDFLIDRNAKWMKVLPASLSKGSQFVAVGALHLAGPYGLVSQLQRLGYTLTPIKL